jgi:hypothetical protein
MNRSRIAGMMAATMLGLASLAVSGCASTAMTDSNSAAAPTAPAGNNEGAGSVAHIEDEQFCASHRCIANFPNGHGEVVQCSDGEWSHSGGITGACADHGGEKGAESSSNESNGAPERESGGGEGPGPTSHAEDNQFCASHPCIANFSNGTGTVVQCTDGKWSHSGGLSGACSDHGGESASTASVPSEDPRESPGLSSSPPLEALNHYWADIRDHGFSEAYTHLAPAARTLSEANLSAARRRQTSKTHSSTAKSRQTPGEARTSLSYLSLRTTTNTAAAHGLGRTR